MIRSLKIVNIDATPVPWAPKAKLLQGMTEFKFENGLNIVWGENGTGKSTLISIMARLLHCEQGGKQKVTAESTRNLGRVYPRGAVLDHDGSPVSYVCPDKTPGLIGGTFDYDFLEKGVWNCQFHGSHGETTVFRINEAIMQAIDASKFAQSPEVECPTHGNFLGDIRAALKGTGERERPTVLLDEPDMSLDMFKSAKLWDILSFASKSCQVIVVTHNALALNIPGAHYVEVDDAYRRVAHDLLIKRLGAFDSAL